MKRQTEILFLSGGLILTTMLALAAKPNQTLATPKAADTVVPMSTVLQNLKINGYEIISKVEWNQGIFNIEAFTPQGEKLSITMNAQSGEITSPKKNPTPTITLIEAVNRVGSAGYHDIKMVKFSGGKYIIKCLDQKDKKVKLKVDGNTGDIKQAWF